MTEPAQARAKRVLIAEDETLVRLDLGEMLGELGYDVVGQAADGEQAVAMATELKPDVAILDVKMPRLDGITAAGQIMEARICPIVMLTAFSQLDLVERAREAGAMAYLVKPFTKADLVPAIEIAVSRHSRSPRSRPRSPISPTASRPASRSNARRAHCKPSTAWTSPRRSDGSRRPPWTRVFRCGG